MLALRKQTDHVSWDAFHSHFSASLMVRQTTTPYKQIAFGPILCRVAPEDVDPRRLPWPFLSNIDVFTKIGCLSNGR